jgi:hypothetical protein
MARGRQSSVVIHLTPEERQILIAWRRSTTIRAGLAKRGRIILMLANGASIPPITARSGSRRFIDKRAERFQTRGL